MARLHEIAWWENIDGAGAETELAAVTDTSGLFQVVSGDYFRVPGGLGNIAGAWANIATAATLTPIVRFQAPSLDERYGRDQAWMPEISTGTSDTEPGSPQPFNDYRQDPIPLTAGEQVRVLHTSNPAVASDQSVVAVMSDGPVAPVNVSGGFWAQATLAAAAAGVGTWTSAGMTMRTPLRTGWYDCFAGNVQEVGTLIGARVVNQYGGNRPPLGVRDSVSNRLPAAFAIPGQMGLLFKLHTNSIPSVEILCNDADNVAQIVNLYLKPSNAPSGY